MNVTFLIGNGFDLNLGLDTTYKDFIKGYQFTTSKDTDNIKNFKKILKEDRNKELWAQAEIAFGQYTSSFNEGEGEKFSECQKDFCKKLAIYLKKEEKKVNFQDKEEKIKKIFSRFSKFRNSFPLQERMVLDSVYNIYQYSDRIMNFICFNYTRTLDNCIDFAKKIEGVLGKHVAGNNTYVHTFGQVQHVHGTVNEKMVFGVNDKSQIAKPEVFQCEDGDIFENNFIKQQTNASYLEDADNKAKSLIINSNIIYIYGMSFGETDKIWWERVCLWLNNNSNNHVIVYKHDAPEKGVLEIDYQRYERKIKKELTRHSDLDKAIIDKIQKRIHVTSENIFAEIKDIANDLPATKVPNFKLYENIIHLDNGELK